MWLCIYKAYFLFLFLCYSALTCIPDGYQKGSSDLYSFFYTDVLNGIFCWRNCMVWVMYGWLIIWEGCKRPHEGLPALRLFTGVRFTFEIQSGGALYNCHCCLTYTFSNMCCGKFYTVIQHRCNETGIPMSSSFHPLTTDWINSNWIEMWFLSVCLLLWTTCLSIANKHNATYLKTSAGIFKTQDELSTFTVLEAVAKL